MDMNDDVASDELEEMDGLDAEQGNHSFHYYPSMPPLD
jgi:hypothetical protein